jgi:uncharacterized membrane-anchored protein YitT (DUF2179 family)
MSKTFKIRNIGRFEQYFFLTMGVLTMAVAYYFFVIPSGLVVGGSTGVAMILHRYLPTIPISFFSLILNSLLLVMAFFLLGKTEFLNSIYGSLLFPLFLAMFEVIVPNPQFGPNDLLLVILYAGMLAGVGFGLVCQYGGSTGGSDILIKIVKRYTPFSLRVSVYLVDGLIILAGALTFPGGINQGMINLLYAIVMVFISGKVSDSMVMGSQSKKAVNVITEKPKEIKAEIFAQLRRGVTEIQSQGGFTETKKTMLIMVILNTEYHMIRRIVATIDPKAFVYVTPASEIQGEWSSKEEVFVKNDEGRKAQGK